jgi:hypothetical protein
MSELFEQIPSSETLTAEDLSNVADLAEGLRAEQLFPDAALRDRLQRIEAAVIRLRQAIRATKQPELPFPEPEGDSAEKADDSWRAVLLVEALDGLPAGILDRMREAELATVGQLQDWINAKGHQGFSDPITEIPGIGPVKAEMVARRLELFWEQRKAALVQVETTEQDEEAE